jgi:hypothetical protein
MIQFDQSYAVGWGTLALINAGLAQGKNKSGFLWFFVSLFIGPIATFLIVISPKSESTLVSQPINLSKKEYAGIFGALIPFWVFIAILFTTDIGEKLGVIAIVFLFAIPAVGGYIGSRMFKTK